VNNKFVLRRYENAEFIADCLKELEYNNLDCEEVICFSKGFILTRYYKGVWLSKLITLKNRLRTSFFKGDYLFAENSH
jgi:hypothetical protein